MGWINIGDKELPRVGHQLASCSLLNSYLLMFLHISKPESLFLSTTAGKEIPRGSFGCPPPESHTPE